MRPPVLRAAFHAACVLLAWLGLMSRGRDGGGGAGEGGVVGVGVAPPPLTPEGEPLAHHAALGVRLRALLDGWEGGRGAAHGGRTAGLAGREAEARVLLPFLGPESGLGGLLDPTRRSKRGIVVPLADRHLRHALFLAAHLGRLTDLPLEMWHLGGGELDVGNLKGAAAKLNLTLDVRSLADVFDPTGIAPASVGRRFGAKIFAALASSFAEVLVLDADSVFLLTPALLFSDPLYTESGTLFQRDRHAMCRGRPHQRAFLRSLLPPNPSPAERAALLRRPLATGASFHDMSSSAVLLDLRRPAVLRGLVGAAALASTRARHGLLAHTHGDKEAWWMGWHLAGAVSANASYAFSPHPIAAIGSFSSRPRSPRAGDPCRPALPAPAQDAPRLCSAAKQAHLAAVPGEGAPRLLYWNGGFAPWGPSSRAGAGPFEAWVDEPVAWERRADGEHCAVVDEGAVGRVRRLEGEAGTSARVEEWGALWEEVGRAVEGGG
ncbi:mannosyltransferase putative-domain-containing protein [Hyaloraphidium curvatum]|nr:mannosyltransferase putative-domain-containing protein [Hyaloraphidium curvatum]